MTSLTYWHNPVAYTPGFYSLGVWHSFSAGIDFDVIFKTQFKYKQWEGSHFIEIINERTINKRADFQSVWGKEAYWHQNKIWLRLTLQSGVNLSSILWTQKISSVSADQSVAHSSVNQPNLFPVMDCQVDYTVTAKLHSPRMPDGY